MAGVYDLSPDLPGWFLADPSYLASIQRRFESVSGSKWKTLRISFGDPLSKELEFWDPHDVMVSHKFCVSYVTRSSSKWSVGSGYVTLGRYIRDFCVADNANYFRCDRCTYLSAPSRLALMKLVKRIYSTYHPDKQSRLEGGVKWTTLTKYLEEKYSKAWLANALLKVGDL